MKKWLFHPFLYLAGTRALIIGWAMMLLTAAICCHSNIHFDGVLDAHSGSHPAPAAIYFIEPLINWACLVAIFFIAGLIFSHSAVRFIDIAGTMALARWVLIFTAIAGFGINTPGGLSVDELVKVLTPLMIFCVLVELTVTIWMVALLYNAFSVSCNIKGGKAAAIFIPALLIAEIISSIILHLIFKQLN